MESQNNNICKSSQLDEKKAKMREYRKRYNEKHKEEVVAQRRARYHAKKQEADALLAAGDIDGADRVFYGTYLYSNKYKRRTPVSDVEDL
jgi:sRNA-binding protein